MAASPEFYKPAPPAFSPPLHRSADQGEFEFLYCSSESCRTPTGSGITYLREPTTCPPAPRKPPPLCRKRLFHQQQHHQSQQDAQAPTIISLRLDELQSIFRPHPPPTTTTQQGDKRRRSSSSRASIQR